MEIRMVKNTKMKKAFIHTIDGLPAQYYDGEQICYGMRRCGVKTVDTLAQIKKEQRASIKFRKKQGWEEDGFDYDYMRIIK